MRRGCGGNDALIFASGHLTLKKRKGQLVAGASKNRAYGIIWSQSYTKDLQTRKCFKLHDLQSSFHLKVFIIP